MSEQIALDVGRNALVMALQVSAPLLVGTLGVGMLISVFQAVTQINEATLSFVPKILVVAATLALLGPWMGNSIVTYTIGIFSMLPTIAR
jgi:flagellar biosynthetic protein FliQ